jgi:hypothetical protein
MQSFAFSITNPEAIMVAIRFERMSSGLKNGFATVSLEPNKPRGRLNGAAFISFPERKCGQ